jgi:hypothetical protein
MDLAQIEARWNTILTADQQEFVQAYLVTQSVKAASEMIGIKPQLGRRYLASPTIQTAIKFSQKSLREGVHVTPEEVVADLRMMRDMAMGRIPVPETKWVDGEPLTRYVRQFNSNAANKAIENLGRVVGMFTDKKEIHVPATDNQLKRRLEELLGTSLDVHDAEFEEIPGDSPTTPQNSLEDLEIPPDLADKFTSLEEDELTTLLAQACDEHKI